FSRLAVTDEIKNALSYYRYTLLRQIPRLYAQLEREIAHRYADEKAGTPSSAPLAPFLQMGSWIGGDRDGNPNVTADTLEDALRRQAKLILEHYLNEVDALR